MTSRRLWLKIVVACVRSLAGISACYALLSDHATVVELRPDHVTVTELQPERVQVGGHGDLVIHIGVHWPKDGCCSGQFTVTATETATQVRVDNVISREYGNIPCAGLGTVNQTVWVGLTLAAPLGDREVVRASDGARLPFTTWPIVGQ
jgi:hypothetical protein